MKIVLTSMKIVLTSMKIVLTSISERACQKWLIGSELSSKWKFCSKCASFALTHWGRVMHICVSKLTIIGSDNGLSPDRRQAIIWAKAGILLIGALRNKLKWNLNQNSNIFIQENAFESVVCETAATLSQPQCVNSSPTSAECMDQFTRSTLVQVKACGLNGPKPLLEPMLTYWQLGLGNKLQWNLNSNSNIFIKENAFENFLCEMVAMLSMGRWVNFLWTTDAI